MELVATDNYQLILMDMQVAVRSRPERHLCNSVTGGSEGVPILTMTFLEERTVCLDAVLNDYISKPVAPEVLFATLLRWLERSEN